MFLWCIHKLVSALNWNYLLCPYCVKIFWGEFLSSVFCMGMRVGLEGPGRKRVFFFFTMCLLWILHSECGPFDGCYLIYSSDHASKVGVLFPFHLVSSGTNNLKQGLNVFRVSSYFSFQHCFRSLKRVWVSINLSVLRFF